ncbi:polyprenol phosphomannose-dependent alpha 1,6 mannosyltransferase MptB, partial [Corynebacterium heidelbergense]
TRWFLTLTGLALITSAGMVKVTALAALGFAGVVLARRWGGTALDLLRAAAACALCAAVVASAWSFGTGVGFGWIFAQGGATEITSWMSMTTLTGLASATLGSVLGLGDHTQTSLTIFRALGAAFGMFWLLRMLLAAFRGRIHPVGGFGVAMFFLVIFFPVVHPWYLLWAIVPLAAWANTRGFRLAVIGYSVAFSFFVLPRGLSLPPATVGYMYVMAAGIFALLLLGGRRAFRTD